MEICRCDEYNEILKKSKYYWTIGTLPPLIKKVEVPKSGWLVWIRNTPTHHDYRSFKSVVRTYHPRTICPEQPLVFDKPVAKIWVPVLPGLISPKLVNESKGLSDRPF